MAFVKLVKNNAHFKRFQTKYRRRREGKTDYRARKRLVTQAKNKFNTPKYRMVVRISKRYVYTQITWATLKGDCILCQATSMELPKKYGLPADFGLKNWTACYATGLLLARRVLKKLGLDQRYQGQTEIDGEEFMTEEPTENCDRGGDPGPFSVCLDVGLQTTSTGARVFGALKGALDGGLLIPHSVRRFPCGEKDSHDAELLKKYIFGGHVGEYMEAMEEDDAEMYAKHFARYIEADVTNDNMEETWQKVYDAIRKDPAHKKSDRKKPAKCLKRKAKLNASQRQDRVNQKMRSFAKKNE
jgi:large subunit ribosomal protein L5e